MGTQRVTLSQIKASIDGLAKQVGHLNKYIVGNGAPEQGLLFRVAQLEKNKSQVDAQQNEAIKKILTQDEKNIQIAKAMPGNNSRILGMEKKLFLTIMDKMLSWLWKVALTLALGDKAVDIVSKF